MNQLEKGLWNYTFDHWIYTGNLTFLQFVLQSNCSVIIFLLLCTYYLTFPWQFSVCHDSKTLEFKIFFKSSQNSSTINIKVSKIIYFFKLRFFTKFNNFYYLILLTFRSVKLGLKRITDSDRNVTHNISNKTSNKSSLIISTISILFVGPSTTTRKYNWCLFEQLGIGLFTIRIPLQYGAVVNYCTIL